ncbi:glycosyl transferase [Paenibacillus sp. sptzw28]|uniref:macrolide family glycosyltransferase n=1 Tax=Paenibacillus sp. sptzw28 TaxID=715179 RepID=UPI001C6E2698|nr:macrolide family glycosyltransferase [Paenibacillus sp. sptzw28]QYR19396.1 glycosyl transferase [Paenibacillus sp. sptzw28]
MSNVLFINGPASGHVYPTLGLVEELIAMGEKVFYVSSEEFRDKLERLGAAFTSYDNFLARENPFETKRYLSLVIKILSSYDTILPCILELAQHHSFDYIIHDSMYGCGNVASDSLGIPNIATCSSFVNSERLLSANRGNTARLKENLLLVKEFCALSANIRAKYNIRRRLDIGDVFFNGGKINLVFTSEYFQPQSESIAEHFKFVGPIVTDRYEPIELPVDRFRGRRVIYISMGTVFNDVKEFYELCFDSLASFDGHVILSVGSRINVTSLESIPDNFTVLPYAPQLQILPYTDVFITHGGMNSVNEALYYNVPLIVIPMAADQPIVGNRVAELGAGLTLDRISLTALNLRESVEEILSAGRYHENSSRIGDSLRMAGGQKKAIEEILKFKEFYKIR